MPDWPARPSRVIGRSGRDFPPLVAVIAGSLQRVMSRLKIRPIVPCHVRGGDRRAEALEPVLRFDPAAVGVRGDRDRPVGGAEDSVRGGPD